MSSNTPHPQATRDAVERLWATGLSASRIGDEVGLNKNKVIGLVRRMGLPNRQSPIDRKYGWIGDALMEEAKQRWDRGIPLRDIAKFLGIAEATFTGRRKRLGWAPRDQALSLKQRWWFTPRKYQSGDGAARRKAARPGTHTPGNPPANAVDALVAPPPETSAPVRAGGPTCCYPFGEGRSMRFCDAPVEARGKPYCKDHRKLCWMRVRDIREMAAA